VGGDARVGRRAQVDGHFRAFGRDQVYTVTPEHATILMLKYGDKIRIESLDSQLVQVYDHHAITERAVHECV
jgi:hypothetical protein